MKRASIYICFLIFVTIPVQNFINAQNRSIYTPKEFEAAVLKGTRSTDGKPGVKYWQNFADYTLNASLNPELKLLKGSGKIKYYNNSPDSLNLIVLKLLQNVYKQGGVAVYPKNEKNTTNGLVIESISVNSKPVNIENRREFSVNGTNGYLQLPANGKLAPKSSIVIDINWNYRFPNNGFREGAYNDSTFFVGYWFPQVAVYDDIYGWDRGIYTGLQETYNDLANFLVEIEVPENYVVWGTGSCTNEKEIFSDEILKRIERSKLSETPVNILTEDDYKCGNIFRRGAQKKWRMSAQNVPDFAWAASNSYLWDGCSAVLGAPANKKVWANAVYGKTDKGFRNVALRAKHSIEYFSNVFPAIAYPFEKHITFHGVDVIAMEFPMIANNCETATDEEYSELTAHELAHNYIPFYALSNERLNAWFDEGWIKLMGEKFGETLGYKRENKKYLNTFKAYLAIAGTYRDIPLITPSNLLDPGVNFNLTYAKSSYAQQYLLELMAAKGVADPLKIFIERWAGKHPTPYDFFNTMDNIAGEELSWFWKPWYFEFSAPDLAILSVNERDGKCSVIIENRGGVPLPINLNIFYKSGESEILNYPVTVWQNREKTYMIIIDKAPVTKIELGSPAIPDSNPANNIWKSNNSNDVFANLSGPYLGQKPPGMNPEIFAPGIISNQFTEWTLAFNPEGTEAFYTIQGVNNMNHLLHLKSNNGIWESPVTAPFSNPEHNADPYITKDGKRLFFWSNGPLTKGGETTNNSDIWYVNKTESGWSEPYRLDSVINTKEWQIFPTVAINGNLYFTSNYPDSKGRFDIYMSEYKDGKYIKPVNLGDSLNTAYLEQEPYISPDESYIIFASDRHSPNTNDWDLYISFKKEDGTWSKAKNMGSDINTKAKDMAPLVTPDGKYLFFSSYRFGNSDVFWVDSKVITKLRHKK